MIDAYTVEFPNVRVDYSITPVDQFQKRLDPVLEKDRGAPDAFALDSTFVRKYVESGLLLDLTDIYEKNKDKLIAYPVQVGTHEGKVYAMSWQSNPGAMFYRRSLAKKYLGTDNPQIIQTYFADFGRLLNSARLIKTRSNGTCAAVASYKDLLTPLFSARQNPWIVNDRINIDPLLDYYFNLAKEMYENRWEGRVDPYTAGWYAGMKGELKDENGRPVEVFAYFLTMKDFENILMERADDTKGDWAMIQGPAGWYRGGSWIAAWKGTKNPQAVNNMIEWLITYEEVVEATEETEEIEATDDSFLGGQDHYAQFSEMAKIVNGRLAQSRDMEIQAVYIEAINAFVKGEKTKQQAIDDFKAQILAEFEEISN